ncbi:MAG: hypothetical protein GY935_26070 [Gammaproteobacteria bacterium]|nr:hypothetical protein [Gammaproteobacteria bacterium]
MLIWVCALHCEAKPIIDFYQLEKSHGNSAFDLYRGDNMACIISGIGKIASAAACAWMAAQQDHEASLAWINLGIAGCARHELGQAFLLNQIIDADTGQRYYPIATASSSLSGQACLTMSQPNENYQDDYLFDMEASGFMYAALRFSSAELTQSIKVISDNAAHKTGKNRQQVSDLIQQNIKQIRDQASALVTLNNELVGLSYPNESWQRLATLTHFSQAQKNRVRVLWHYLMNRDFQVDDILRQLQACTSASTIIEILEQLSHQDSERL